MSLNILTPLRDHLVAQGIVRKPSVTGTLPTLWLEPQTGLVAPGETPSDMPTGKSNIVVGAYLTGGFTQPTFIQQQRQQVIVDFRYRVKGPTELRNLQSLDRQILQAVCDRRDWDLSDQHIVESLQLRALQRLGSDEQGYNFAMSAVFEYQIPGGLYS
ncbi:MAG: hypothetical protein H0W81_06555 [Chloroflexi bacterium]|nr:hypothetical protein [Chloroflexota bacterium]